MALVCRPNVCVERKEEIDTPAGGEQPKPSTPEPTTNPDAEDTTTPTATERDREPLESDDDDEAAVKPARLSSPQQSFASFRLSSCQETLTKHECKTT